MPCAPMGWGGVWCWVVMEAPPVVKKNQENNIVNRTKAVQLIQGRIEPNSWSEV